MGNRVGAGMRRRMYQTLRAKLLTLSLIHYGQAHHGLKFPGKHWTELAPIRGEVNFYGSPEWMAAWKEMQRRLAAA